MKQNKSLSIGIIVATISFILIYLGMKFINNSELIARNIVAYGVFSVVLGGVSATFHYYKLVVGSFFIHFNKLCVKCFLSYYIQKPN